MVRSDCVAWALRRLRSTASLSLIPVTRVTVVSSRRSHLQSAGRAAVVNVNADRAQEWIKNGAQPTDTVRGILKKAGVLN